MFRNCGAGLVLFAAACASDVKGDEPPAESFYFPSGLALSSDGSRLYVLNANFDLRFNAGWVSEVDVDATIAGLQGAGDPRGAITAQLKVPSLGSALALSPSGRAAVVTARGVQPVSVLDVDAAGRISCGDPSATAGLSFELELTDCDADHLLEITPELIGVPSIFPEELEDTFAVSVFDRPAVCGSTCACRPACFDDSQCSATLPQCTGGVCACTPTSCGAGLTCEEGVCVAPTDDRPLVALSYLSRPSVSVFALAEPPKTSIASLQGVVERNVDDPRTDLRPLFQDLNSNINTSIGALAPRPGSSGLFLAATLREGADSGSSATTYSLNLGRFFNSVTGPDLAVSPPFVSSTSVAATIPAVQMFDIAFTPDGQRALALTVDRSVNSAAPVSGVVLFDTSLERFPSADNSCYREAPAFEILDAVALGGWPQGLHVLPAAAGQPGANLAAVTNFETNRLFLLAIEGDRLTIVDRLDTPEGPYRVTSVVRNNRTYLLVATFFDHGLWIVDITEPTPERVRVLGQVKNPALGTSERR